MLQFAVSVSLVMGLTGCAAGNFASHGNPESRMDGPACYRETKANYEAAGTGPDPNAALVNIGTGLMAKDDGFEHCVPAAGREQIR
jgi:hypothetical protein